MTNNIEEALKPCPFCGGEDVGPNNGDGWHAKKCMDGECGAEGPAGRTPEDATILWNTRADTFPIYSMDAHKPEDLGEKE